MSEYNSKDITIKTGPGDNSTHHGHRHHHQHHHHHHHHHEKKPLVGVRTPPYVNDSTVHKTKKPTEILPRLADGTTVGNYRIIKTLGSGSFGKVKLAYHIKTGQRVALKIINKVILSKSDMQGRIEREISYLRLLRHPHIIKLYDVIKSKDELIIVLEYAEHELFDYITSRERLTEDNARRFFQEIISAVEYCHRHKVVHRDLKPENLLLDAHYRVKITDFGLSNIMTDGNFLKTSCGSPCYAAPEIIGGKLYAGPEVDIWSCGVILYVLLCHKLPFDSDSLPKLFRSISNGVYILPNFLSPAAANLIKRMLIVNPLGRITIKEIMEDEWFKEGIPEYLVPQYLKQEVHKDKEDTLSLRNDPIDDELILALSTTMGYGIDEIYESLENNEDEPGLNEIRDAYFLMKENKTILKDLELVRSDSDVSLIDSRSGNVIDTIATHVLPSYQKKESDRRPLDDQLQRTYGGERTTILDTKSSDITILPTSLPQIHRVNMFAEGFPGAGIISPMLNVKPISRWHFGIRSHSYPLIVMGEVYGALRRLNAKWIRTTERELWTIKAKWKWDGNTKDKDVKEKLSDKKEPMKTGNESSDVPEMMKIVIQLFQTHPSHFLVDLKFDGWENSDDEETPSRESTPTEDYIAQQEMGNTFSAYPFLNFTTKLINELARNHDTNEITPPN